MSNRADLSVDFCGVRFKNPFLLSSSPVSNSAEMINRAFDAGWSGVAYKTIVTDRAPIAHPSPRMCDYRSCNNKLVGIQNVEQLSDRGLRANLLDIKYLKQHWPEHPILSSIMGFTEQEWIDLAQASEDAGADMIELNLSCPHMMVEGTGSEVGEDDELVERCTAIVKDCVSIPVLAKLTPNITDMNVLALRAKAGGADGIVAINTVKAIAGVDPENWIPAPNVFGKGASSGYSGPAIKPIGLRFISDMAGHPELKLPLSGIGGIETWIDALEYILLGAATIQVTSGILRYGYGIVEDMIEGLSDYMNSKSISSINQLVGQALPNICSTSDFDYDRQGIVEYDLEKCIGCGQCYTVCRDAGGDAIIWNSEKRKPVLNDDKCLSCMICSFVCPINGLIKFKEMPADWKRDETITLGGKS